MNSFNIQLNKKVLLISILSILIFNLSGCKHKNRRPILDNSGNHKELKQIIYGFDNPPKFRKDGELRFLNSNKDTLFFINTEVVNTDVERMRGLMFRPEMDENNGMLFIMEKEDYQSFYMRNTIIPLDIIYINSNCEIVDIYKNTKVRDETSLPSSAVAKYVVEINAGLCDKYNIEKGNFVVIY
ncbi:MAG: DUF192 domain-containing protein [Bacteroidales bacterium]|jgi:uncharacterized membrane protein (UPF0127 family)|nr:DUF192 domain-containing protein [Bacteroidales bacterium]